jgi:hypothetical protein
MYKVIDAVEYLLLMLTPLSEEYVELIENVYDLPAEKLKGLIANWKVEEDENTFVVGVRAKSERVIPVSDIDHCANTGPLVEVIELLSMIFELSL